MYFKIYLVILGGHGWVVEWCLWWDGVGGGVVVVVGWWLWWGGGGGGGVAKSFSCQLNFR